MSDDLHNPKCMNLREQVELLLPNWQSWYPSLFDAAYDLGLIRARVCAPSLLLLSVRHAAVQSEAVQAFREQWSAEEPEEEESVSALTAPPLRPKHKLKQKTRGR
jgi:hypothetical protein